MGEPDDHHHCVHLVPEVGRPNRFCHIANQTRNATCMPPRRRKDRETCCARRSYTAQVNQRRRTRSKRGRPEVDLRTVFETARGAQLRRMTTAAPSDGSVDGAVTTLPDIRRGVGETDGQQRPAGATEGFAARGFTAVTTADVVDHSAAGIGSIYHTRRERAVPGDIRPTGGRHRPAHRSHRGPGGRTRPAACVRSARPGVPQADLANRRTAMVPASGDNPAGFDGVHRHSIFRGFRRWMSVLELDPSPRGQLLTRILIAVMAESAN